MTFADDLDLGTSRSILMRYAFIPNMSLVSKLVNPLPDNKFQTSKLKEFADDNFKFDVNGRKLSKQIENTVGKGEIARYEQFLLFPQCFKRLVSQGRQQVSLCGNGLRSNWNMLSFHVKFVQTDRRTTVKQYAPPRSFDTGA